MRGCGCWTGEHACLFVLTRKSTFHSLKCIRNLAGVPVTTGMSIITDTATVNPILTSQQYDDCCDQTATPPVDSSRSWVIIFKAGPRKKETIIEVQKLWYS